MLLLNHIHCLSCFLLSSGDSRRGYGRQVSIPVVMCSYLCVAPRHVVTLKAGSRQLISYYSYLQLT